MKKINSTPEKNTTELVFILDQSGSMYGQAMDVVGGFNSMISQQKRDPSRAWVTTVLFSTRMERLYDRLDLNKVPPMTLHDYQPCGGTALYDAIGQTIDHIRQIHKYIWPEDVPARTVFIITTDGMENASSQFSQNGIKKKIETMKKEYGWEFVFAAANIDSEQTASSIGICKEQAVSFNAQSSRGVEELFENLNETVAGMRSGQYQRGTDLRKVFSSKKRNSARSTRKS